VGTEFWSGMRGGIENVMLNQENNISAKDMDLIPIVDEPDEIVKIIRDFYSGDGHPGNLKPNYEL